MAKTEHPVDFSRAAWRKSSRSSGNGACVEVAAAHNVIAVRDSKNPNGGHLAISRQSFRQMINRVCGV